MKRVILFVLTLCFVNPNAEAQDLDYEKESQHFSFASAAADGFLSSYALDAIEKASKAIGEDLGFICC